MGEIVAAAVFAHAPGIMAPEPVRKAMGGGRDMSLVASMPAFRQRLDATRPDTFVIFDTHWFTTIEHVVAGAEHFSGIYTSEELPTLICDKPYDCQERPRSPQWRSRAPRGCAAERGLKHMAVHYPTLNALHYLTAEARARSRSPDGEPHNVIRRCSPRQGGDDQRVALLASGGMSHRFWPMDTILQHGGWDAKDIHSAEAVAIDRKILALWSAGDHEAVIDLWPEYRRFAPEGFFGHYLMLAGALGGRACVAKGVPLSDYENAVGTAQAHVWFEL
jgi:aromatic ring-opening dioxygenase catalytic subunit (LigB family)